MSCATDSGAVLPEGSSLTGSPFLAIAELGGQRPDARVQLAAAITRGELEELLGDDVQHEEVVEWRASDRGIVAVHRERLGAIVLRETALRDAEPMAVAQALLSALTTEHGLSLTWSEDASRLRARLAFLHRHVGDWPDVGDYALRSTAHEWLLPHLVGLRRRQDVEALDLGALLLARLSWRQRAELDELAPTHGEVPSGSRIRIDYSDPEAPVLAVTAPGTLRPRCDTDCGARFSAADPSSAVAGASTCAGHTRPRGVLAQLVLRGAEGIARPLPEACLARRSDARRAHSPYPARCMSGDARVANAPTARPPFFSRRSRR